MKIEGCRSDNLYSKAVVSSIDNNVLYSPILLRLLGWSLESRIIARKGKALGEQSSSIGGTKMLYIVLLTDCDPQVF